MNIPLTPELERLIDEKVKSGLYGSPSEVVSAGLRLLKREDDLHRFDMERSRGEAVAIPLPASIAPVEPAAAPKADVEVPRSEVYAIPLPASSAWAQNDAKPKAEVERPRSKAAAIPLPSSHLPVENGHQSSREELIAAIKE